MQVPIVFVSQLNTMYPDHGQSLCYLFCEYRQQLWAALFTFNPYLLISINELLISIIHLLISINELLISINELLISINEL